MPDLRFFIAGNWSDRRINITQEPREGTFLPMSGQAAATSQEWIDAGFGGPTPDSLQARVTIFNPTDAGPEGNCSFRLFVGDVDSGPPLCPGACPPPLLALPITSKKGSELI
eukprot:tig00000396_g24914.t1